VQPITEERFPTVVSKINAVWNRSPEKNIRPEPQAQPTGMSKHNPESERSLEPLSRKETQAQSAVKNQIVVSNSSPKQNRSVATQTVPLRIAACSLNDEPEKKNSKIVHFTHLARRSPWTDVNQIW